MTMWLQRLITWRGAVRQLVVVVLSITAYSAVSAQTTLSYDSRRVLDLIRKKNSTIAKLMLVTDPSQTAAVGVALRALGGEIRFEEDRVGYVRVIVPIAKVDAVTQIAGVQVVEPYYREGQEEAARIGKMIEENEESNRATPKVDLPADVPQPPAPFVTQDLMGISRLRMVNPNFDGRGVTIAFVEQAPLFTHPELRWARTLDGHRVPKLLDVVPTSLPQDGNDPWWVDMRATVTARDDKVLFDGKSYRVPASGTYSIGMFTDPLAGKLAANVHNPKKPVEPSFAVLWNIETNTVWVDTNQNQDLTDEQPLTDYSKRKEFGMFGPASGALDQKVAFTVYTAPHWHALHLTLGAADHCTMTASTAAGNREDGGLFDGVAPNAQIISYDGLGGTPYATEYIYTEALIRALSDPSVDVVSVSLGFGSDIPNIVMARLSSVYDKPVAYAALLHSLPPVFTTAMYMDRETLRRNLGITGERDEFVVGQRFTLPDGRLVPDVLGPVNSLAAGSALHPFKRPNTHWLNLPLGYEIGGGSSQSTPMCAGLVADVISAARQTHTPVDLSRLTAAVRTGSRWISEVPGSNKSAPLPQADQVWNALRKLAKVPPSRIDVAAPITTFSGASKTGIGVVDEQGSENFDHTYRVSLVRQSEPANPVTYDLNWLGNDGTFSAPEMVTLRKGQAAIVETHATPRSAGVTTAVLELIDRATRAVVQQVPHSVTVPLELKSGSSQPVTDKLMIEQHGERELVIPARAEGTVIEVEIASADPDLSCWVRSPSNQWLLMEQKQIPRHEVIPQLGPRPQWERLADVSSLGLSAGYGFRAVLGPDAPGLWHLSLRRRGQPDIELPHTHTLEDMKSIPVIVRVQEVNQSK